MLQGGEIPGCVQVIIAKGSMEREELSHEYFRSLSEGFNDWGGRGYDAFVPGDSPKRGQICYMPCPPNR